MALGFRPLSDGSLASLPRIDAAVVLAVGSAAGAAAPPALAVTLPAVGAPSTGTVAALSPGLTLAATGAPSEACKGFAGYPNPYQAEAIKYGQWAANCCALLIQGQADVVAGLRTMPTPEQAIAELPIMVW